MKGILKKSKIIVGSYLGLKMVQVCYSAIIVNESTQMFAARSLGFVIPMLLAIFAFRNNKFSQWLLAITIVVGGVTGLVTGIFRVPLSQYILKTIFISLGLYLSLGGAILIKITRNKEIWA